MSVIPVILVNDRSAPSDGPSLLSPTMIRLDRHQAEFRATQATLLRWIGRIGVVAWACVWGIFIALTAFSEGAPALGAAAALVGILALCVLLVWTLPVVGGVLLNVVGVAAAVFFRHPAARTLLAVPAVLLGVMTVLGAIQRRTRDEGPLPR